MSHLATLEQMIFSNKSGGEEGSPSLPSFPPPPFHIQSVTEAFSVLTDEGMKKKGKKEAVAGLVIERATFLLRCIEGFFSGKENKLFSTSLFYFIFFFSTIFLNANLVQEMGSRFFMTLLCGAQLVLFFLIRPF